MHQIVGARTNSEGGIEFLVHWEKLDGSVYPQDQCTWEAAEGIDVNQLDYDFLHSKRVEASTKKRQNTGQFVECQAGRKRCKLSYDGKKADQWLVVSKPAKDHSWQLTGYDLCASSDSESEESGDASDEDAETSE